MTGTTASASAGRLLADELADYLAESRARMPAEMREAMRKATEDLRLSGIAERALKVGDIAPDFTLPDARGTLIASRDLLARGPVVISYYRGGWCPYCNMELVAFESILGEITARGASMVAISPQAPDASLTTVQKHDLAYPVLSDRGLAVASAFGIAYTLPPVLQTLYTGFGVVLPELNGTGDWRLPLPATYVVGADGRILLADVDADYTRRFEPRDVLAVLWASAGRHG